jgi:hypothetical protein
MLLAGGNIYAQNRSSGSRRSAPTGVGGAYGDANVEPAQKTAAPPDARTPTPAPESADSKIARLTAALTDATNRISKLEDRANGSDKYIGSYVTTTNKRIVTVEGKVAKLEINTR